MKLNIETNDNPTLSFRAGSTYFWRGSVHYYDAPDRAMRLPLQSYNSDFQYAGRLNGATSEDNERLTNLVKEVTQEVCNYTKPSKFWMNK